MRFRRDRSAESSEAAAAQFEKEGSDRLVKHFEKYGERGFKVVRTPEAMPIAFRKTNNFVPRDIPEASMPLDRMPTPYEQVAYSSVARIIADRLAYTGLADPQNGSGDIADSWSDSEVIQATLGILNKLDAEGYAIVSKPEVGEREI